MARSHAWLAWPPLDFSDAAESGQACITHDEANRLLLVAGRSKVQSLPQNFKYYSLARRG